MLHSFSTPVVVTLLVLGAPRLSAPSKPGVQTPSSSERLSIHAEARCEEGALLALQARWPGAEKATFTWSVVRGPKASFASPGGASVKLTAPQALADYELEIECRGVLEGQTQTARHVVRVSADDDVPIAQNFVTPKSECGAMLLLTGQGQNPEILQGITYQWRQVGEGPRVTLEYADRPQSWCTPPEQGAPYKLQFEFAVSDGVNKPSVSKVEVEIECDPLFAPLAPEQVLELPRAAFVESSLPRGPWIVSGVMRVEPQAADKPAYVTFRMPHTPRHAAALTYEAREGSGLLRRYELNLDGEGAWKEPHMSGNQDLGEWPMNKRVGFEISWDGFELAIRFGEPGARASWSEPQFPSDLKLNSRPRSVYIDVGGAKLELEALQLRGK